jgi:hypothetical protein
MANNENLKPFTSDQSREEAVKNGRKGGIASGEARRERKKIKEYLEIALASAIKDKQGNEYTRLEAGVLKLVERYVKGDQKAFDTVVELLGEKPALKQEITNTTPQIVVANETDLKALEELKNADINKGIS